MDDDEEAPPGGDPGPVQVGHVEVEQPVLAGPGQPLAGLLAAGNSGSGFVREIRPLLFVRSDRSSVSLNSLFVSGDRRPADALTARAKDLWVSLAGVTVGFASAMSAAVSPGSFLCPPGWVGIVVLGDAALVTAPDYGTARVIEKALGGVPAASLADDSVLRSRLPGAEFLGPAALAYLDPAEFRAWPGGALTTPVHVDDPGFRELLLAADAEDVEESGIGKITTPAFVVREHGQVVAAAGYRDWPLGTAHLSVLTAPAARGRGHARAAASAAVAHAIQSGKLPQWRARPQASRRVALALGFRELGSQVSIHLDTAVGSHEH